MTPSSLSNDNRVSIDGLEIGKKVKEKPVYQAPVGLALYVLKDRKDHIGFELPVSGNPSSPRFKLRRIIWKTFEEFLLKTATQPLSLTGFWKNGRASFRIIWLVKDYPTGQCSSR